MWGRSDQGPGFAGEKAPVYDPEWRLGQGSPGFLRKMLRRCCPLPTALDCSLIKGFLPTAALQPVRTLEAQSRRWSEGGQWVAPGQSVRLGSDGMAQCSCDLAPPFTGLKVTGDMEGGASAAKSGLCPPGQEPSPLWDCLLIGIMQDIGDFSGPEGSFCSDASGF